MRALISENGHFSDVADWLSMSAQGVERKSHFKDDGVLASLE